MEGWIRLHRKLKGSFLWDDPERLKWWIDLLFRARHTDGEVIIKGRKVAVRRGECVVSITTLSREWGVNHRTVKRFLNLLESAEQISVRTTNLTSFISITNYDAHQGGDDKSTEQSAAQSAAQSTYEEECKEGKNEKKVLSVEEFFDRYKKFAARTAKLQAPRSLTAERRKKIKARLSTPGWLADFKEAIQSLPLGGSGWQPNLDWLIRNESNMYRILEGEFSWRNADDPAMAKLEAQRRKKAADARIKAAEEEKAQTRLHARQDSEAIGNILNPPDGETGGDEDLRPLFG